MNLADLWYGRAPLGRIQSALLAPLGWLFCGVAVLRALAYRRGWFVSEAVGVPVIMVGNLTVGGTGKTPLALWLVRHLRQRGLRPGIAMRGYGSNAGGAPRLVPADGDPFTLGDEPVLLAARGGCPVVVSADRVAAARLLATRHRCDVVVCDDGLQHYRLRRDCEILVVDGERRFGNGRCLPAGPLREPRRRVRQADLVIVNGDAVDDPFRFTLVPGQAVNLYDAARCQPLRDFAGARVTAVAGIGNPARFFAMLRHSGLDVEPHPYPDHHRYSATDLSCWPAGPVLMTEKDAVKCRVVGQAGAEHWYVPVQAEPNPAFVVALERALAHIGI